MARRSSSSGKGGAKGPYPGLPASAFVYPSTRRYPINTSKRAHAALSYSARKDTAGSYARVERAVHARYPGIHTRVHPGGHGRR